jgi:dienelactone hydrolase
MSIERVTFKTQDNVTIVGDWYQSNKNDYAALLLHMMPAKRDSWRDFAFKLQEAQYATLAIDLRGHGESTNKNGIELNYKNFSDAEHQQTRLDVEASLKFLENKGFALEKIIVGGASIGANLTIEALAAHPQIKRGIALSPGLDYRGITTEDKVKKLNNTQKIFLAAGAEDEYSTQSVNALQKLTQNNSTLHLYTDNAGHGTTMFEKHPELMNELIEWILVSSF